jgi:ABC-type polysaccharide/polyol phosphate export permease
MSTVRVDVPPVVRQAGRRLGYGLAVIINLVMLIVVQNILDWGWLDFLTVEFAEVVPWISISLAASILVNLVYQVNDGPLIKSSGQLSSNLISIFVTFYVFQVFPFDFSSYDFNWGIVVRILLILAMVGAGIGMLVEAYKLASHEPEQERR